MAVSTVDYRLDGAVAVIELRRPAARNALDAATKEQLLVALQWAGADGERPDGERSDGERARAVLIRAEGPAFCVGQDLAEHARALDADPGTAFDTVPQHYNPLVTAFHALPQPVVAAVEGACVGAGLGLALGADLRVAGDTAFFATAFAGVGLAADTGVSRALTRLLGASRAAGLLLLGDRFSAEEAARWGLVHRVVPAGQAAQAGLDLARQLAAGPTAAFAETKALLRAAADGDLDAALEREAAAQRRLGATADHRNAVRAFLNREKPHFEGR
ncbi:enoyl-CoA hydratase-related protein [Streptomyces sp. B6B3]|uniref:enoyl-CoA hydratase/isomerase family protein n=1 Tax=Streptomyces sp. B6B3 TaxID=3153570 RepID=UPI00325E8B23